MELKPKGSQSMDSGIRDGNEDGVAGSVEPGEGGGGRRFDVGVADSSSEVKEERNKNHGLSSDQDLLNESLSELESAQEALEKELLKLKEMGGDILAYDSVSDSGMEFIDNKQSTSSMQLPGEGTHSFSQSVQSKVLHTTNEVSEIKVEDLFRQNFEAEVEYMAISNMVQKLRAAAVDQVSIFEEQKALVSEQTQMLDKLGVAESKAALLEKEAKKLESICQDIACGDEIIKLEKGVCKYCSFFLMQLLLLLVLFGAFVFRFTPSYVEFVPT